LESVGKQVFAVVLIAFGALLLIGTLGLVNLSFMSYFWPLLFILIGGTPFLTGRKASVMNSVTLALGLILLYGNISDEHDFGDLWPLLIIVAGAHSFLSASQKRKQ